MIQVTSATTAARAGASFLIVRISTSSRVLGALMITALSAGNPRVLATPPETTASTPPLPTASDPATRTLSLRHAATWSGLVSGRAWLGWGAPGMLPSTVLMPVNSPAAPPAGPERGPVDPDVRVGPDAPNVS